MFGGFAFVSYGKSDFAIIRIPLFMKLMQQNFVLFCTVLMITSCTTTRSQFGQVIIAETTDTLSAKQEISKIRALSNDIFDSASFTGKDQVEIRYRLFKPREEQYASERLPLVIVFHSSGRPVGTDNSSQLGLVQKLFASPGIQEKYPAFILAPQFPTRSSDYISDSSRHLLTSRSRTCLDAVIQLTDSLRQHLNIDNDRIYLVGYSMGGSTVINALSARPELFAAGISISGIPEFDKIQTLATIPIWLIHGIDDTENPIASDEQFYKELKSNRIRFWKLNGTTHDNVFSTRLLGDALPKWLFSQHKR